MAGYCPHGWIRPAKFPMQFPDRQVANGATSSVEKDMFEIQVEDRIHDCKVNAQRVVVRVSQAKLADHNGTQKRRIDLVDVDSEALLARPPPNPPTNTVGDGRWRKPECQ
jgi:hypothetical protein